MRAHGTFNSPRWPWAFGDDVLAATKKAIELRYRLIPYYYTFAAQTEQTGAPLMRPLFLEFPDDAKTYNMEDEWLMGDRLLAAPVLAQGGARDVYLPAGGWFDFNTGASVSGGQTLHLQLALGTIPAYVRAGTILPLGPVIQSTSLGAEDPLEVRVYPGQDASFTLYEDDGSTYAYRQGARQSDSDAVGRRSSDADGGGASGIVRGDAGDAAFGGRAAGWREADGGLYGECGAGAALDAVCAWRTYPLRLVAVDTLGSALRLFDVLLASARQSAIANT